MINQDIYHGKHYGVTLPGTTFRAHWMHARLISVKTTAAGSEIKMPPTTFARDGGWHFVVFNQAGSSDSLDLVDEDSNLLLTLPVAKWAKIGYNGTAWQAFQVT